MRNNLLLVCIFILLTSISCTSKAIEVTEPSDQEIELDIYRNLPSSFSKFNRENFDRYTFITTPNGKHIYIIAQNEITTYQIVRCRNILKHYLTNFPNSVYGVNKSAVANSIADKGSILCLLNGYDGGNKIGDRVSGQPLYHDEIQVEGGEWYMQQNYEHRDASYEEILHFVHDNGIGIDGLFGSDGALPEFQKKIRAAQVNALEKGLWGVGEEEWIKELKRENSLSQEYLASVIDSYYGLWGAWEKDVTGGMWGIYVAKDREEIYQKDILGSELVNGMFFHPYLTYDALLDSSFSGDFSLRYNESLPYTNHSRYLKDITFTGENDTRVIVNELDNHITGNEGVNTVVFSSTYSNYSIKASSDSVIVKDTRDVGDGNNILKNVEKLEFKDKTVSVKGDLLSL